jgi:excisionase family DNA binding protein
MNEETKDLISVTQAAERLGLSRKRVFEFIRDQRLPAVKVGSAYVIKTADLELVKERKTGRPPLENPSKAALAKRRQRERKSE